MSTTPPPDRPTERLQPSPPAPQYERVVEPRGPVATDPTFLLTRLEDAISSLRTWLVLVGVLAAAALGLALYAVLSPDDGTTRGAASSERVSRLDDRVDRLSRQVQELRSSSRGTDALSGRVDALSRQIATLRSQGSSSTDTTRAIEDLNRRVDDLSRQVQRLGGQTQTTP